MLQLACILFLHHSTGNCIWKGGVPEWFDAYNKANGTDYRIIQQAFPKSEPYGWHNYPYDYWNIWVNHAGPETYKEEPTLEMLTKEYNIIVWKHCFPGSNIQPDTGKPDIQSDVKSLENYKLQYAALKEKMHSFPETKFIVWTNAALIADWTNPEEAARSREFVDWVKNEWDEPGDNIFIWDFFELETDGGSLLNPAYAMKDGKDAHPNEEFSRRTAPLMAQRIVDVIEGRGDSGSLTGNPHP